MADPVIQDQPDPTKNDHPPVWPIVVDEVRAMSLPVGVPEEIRRLVVADMEERDRLGFERYGTQLQTFNGRDSLVDAYQEALDLCVYLRTEMLEVYGKGGKDYYAGVDMYKRALELALDIRKTIHKRSSV